MGRHAFSVLAAALLPMLISALVWAQAPMATEAGKITGVVVSKGSQVPMAGMWLWLARYEGRDSAGNDVLSLFLLKGGFPRVLSDDSGRFTFADVPPGRYIIKSGTETGYEAQDKGATALKDGSGNVIIVRLESAHGIDLGRILVQR